MGLLPPFAEGSRMAPHAMEERAAASSRESDISLESHGSGFWFAAGFTKCLSRFGRNALAS